MFLAEPNFAGPASMRAISQVAGSVILKIIMQRHDGTRFSAF